jgi:hypothetical protein
MPRTPRAEEPLALGVAANMHEDECQNRHHSSLLSCLIFGPFFHGDAQCTNKDNLVRIEHQGW